MRLKRDFYKRPAFVVAKDLLGKYLVRIYKNRKIIGKIVETEAYVGPEDKASHGFGGKRTSRNEAEFLEGGHIYIYLVYGMYWQLNITTGHAGKPECVLIRALEPIKDIKNIKNQKLNIKNTHQKPKNICEICGRFVKICKLANGPGKLCRYMNLDKSFYGEDLTRSKKVWLEDRGEAIKRNDIVSAKRIGIDYAGEWKDKPWRFYIKNNPFVSKF